MRSHAKQLTIIQENHFQTQLVEINKIIRNGKFRVAYTLINKEFERSLIMQTGWRIRIQLLRRGIICLIKILKQYARETNKHDNQLKLSQKLQQFLLFYVELLQNHAQEYRIFYLKDLLYRISQIHVLCFQLSKHHEDVRSMLYWKPSTYYKDPRFHKIKFQYFIQVAHLNLQFKLFNDALIYYSDAITECQAIITCIVQEDYHLHYLYDQYCRIITQVILILYFMSLIYELQSDYNKLLESLKLANWLCEITDCFGLQTFIEEQYRLQYRQYFPYMIELKEVNQILAPIFPEATVKQVQESVNDYWSEVNDGFYNKYNKEFNNQLYSILQVPDESLYMKKLCRLTEQETTIQSNILTPRQYEKCRTFNSLDDVKISKQTTTNPSPQHSHRPTPHLIKTKTFKFTSDIDSIMKRLPQREIESFQQLKAKKELDSYYQQKVLQSFENATQIRTLKSIKQQMISQEEINKVCQSDLIVGKKLLKFQKYTHQRVATHQNITKIMSDIAREQEHLEGVNSARLMIQGNHDIEHKIRVHMQQIIKKKSLHNEGELMVLIYIFKNLKSLVSDYETNLQKHPTAHDLPIEQSLISKHLRERNTQIGQSIDQTIKRTIPEQIKNRKSFLSRVQESLFKK